MAEVFRIVITFAVLLLVLSPAVAANGSREEAETAIEKAESVISEMISEGFGVTYANDTLSESKILFSQGYYEGSLALAQKVIEIKGIAEEIQVMIGEAEIRMFEVSSNNLDISEAESIFNRAIEEFEVDNYEDAKELLERTTDKLKEIEEKGSLRAREESPDLGQTLMANVGNFIVALLVIILAGIVLRRTLLIKRMRISARSLKNEQMKIEKIVEETQKKYFRDGKMGKREYDSIVREYQGKLSEIAKQLDSMRKK